MCLPALAAARSLLPRAEMVALVTDTTRTVLSAVGIADRFLMATGAPLRLRPSARRAARDLEARLSAEAFDLALVLLGDDYAPMLTRAGIRHRVFVAESAFASLGSATYAIGHARTWGPEERLGAWRALGLDPGHPAAVVRPSSEAEVTMRGRLRGRPRPWVVLHALGRTADQRWPLAAAVAAARLIREGEGGTSILVGTPVATTSGVPTGADVLDLIGALRLDELIALLAAADCVVSTDSGPYHLAGAMARPGVGLFRASRPEHAARYPTMAAVVAPARPECREACAWDRCAFSPCRQMSAIAPEAVAEAARSVLRAS